MANEVEQILIDAQRALRDRGLAHRSSISEVMAKQEEAMVAYIDRLNAINDARHKLDEEAHKAFEAFREALRQQGSTLLLVRDMHPVLEQEQQGEQKKLANGSKGK